MRALKTLVVVMGVMLVVGFVALVIAIAERVSNKEPRTAAAPPQPVTAAPIALPTGAQIEKMATANDRLVLDIALPSGEHRLLIIDLATGRTLVTIPLHAAP